MTLFEAWIKACEEMNQQVVLLADGGNSCGDRLRLYVLIRQLPPIPVYGYEWLSQCERYFILWFNDEKFQSFTDYMKAFRQYQDCCNAYIYDKTYQN